MRGRGRIAGGMLVVVALLGGVACDGGDDAESARPPPATDAETAPQAACSLVTAADATALFGEPAQPKVEDQPESVASQCIYESVSLLGQLLQFRIFQGERYFSGDVAHDAKTLKHLGEKAYIDTDGPEGIVDLQFVADGHVYALAYSNTTGNAAARAAGRVKALARTVAQRLE